MPLSILTLTSAKPREKPYKLADGNGLHLQVAPSGSKWWRWRYQFAGKEQMLSLGTFPKVTLKQAREKRDDARRLLDSGINPSQQRKAQKLAVTTKEASSLEVVAREWHAQHLPGWNAAYADLIMTRFTQNLFPWLGSRPIADITAPELLPVLRRIQDRGAMETAHRCRRHLSQVFHYGMITGRCLTNPALALDQALKPVQPQHLAAVTDPAQLAIILKTMDSYQGSPPVVAALRLAPYLFVRPGELRHAKWQEIDLDKATWSYWITKTKTDHIVPLATQAVAILRELHCHTGRRDYVFSNSLYPKRPMSENTVSAALVRMDLKDITTGHGFRATARTILDEVLHVRVDYIEHQLAHAVRDPNGRAYNRTHHLPERKVMMQQWADYLDTLRAS